MRDLDALTISASQAVGCETVAGAAGKNHSKMKTTTVFLISFIHTAKIDSVREPEDEKVNNG